MNGPDRRVTSLTRWLQTPTGLLTTATREPTAATGGGETRERGGEGATRWPQDFVDSILGAESPIN